MFSKLFGSKKKETVNTGSQLSKNWGFLKTDMHSHLLPGIDDGAQTMEESIEMIRSLQAMGYESIVTTPHIKSDIYPNNPAIINNALQELQQALKANNINIPIKAAAEYYVDDHFMDLLANETLLTIHQKEILIEFSFVFEPVRLYDTIFRIQTKGYTPVLAHPERYAFFHSKPEIFSELKNRGCKLQLNAISLGGYYGKTVKEMAERLINEGFYDYCGSDMHHARHVDTMNKLSQSKSFSLLSNYPFLNNKIEMI